MPTNLMSDWRDCLKFWPYRDFEGRWQFPTPATHTQKRLVIKKGQRVTQYREREETADEWEARQV